MASKDVVRIISEVEVDVDVDVWGVSKVLGTEITSGRG